jgi:prepilin-type processing-associated H-X9-DG protein
VLLVDISYAQFAAYNHNAAIYLCPKDVSAIQEKNGAVVRRTRSYSLNDVLGYDGPRGFTKLSRVVNPGPADQFAFLDENPNSIGVPSFYFAPDSNTFESLPATYHNNSSAISFLDGHVETHHWRNPKTQMPLNPIWIDYEGTYSYYNVFPQIVEPGGPDPQWLHSKSAPDDGGF